MKTKIIPIKDIKIDDKLYPRDKLNDQLVLDYFHSMKDGVTFPDVFVALFNGEYLLVDGRHRLEAKKYLGEEYIQADIKTNFPSVDDIYLESVKSNIKHGLRLNKHDRIKIAFTMSDLKFETADITKLIGISKKMIDTRKAVKIKHIFIKDKVKSGVLPTKIREKLPVEVKTELINQKDIDDAMAENKEEFAVYELEQIFNFFVKEDLRSIESRTIDNLIGKIKRLLKKKYSKL